MDTLAFILLHAVPVVLAIILIKVLVWPVLRKPPFEHRMSVAVDEHESLAKVYDGLRQPELAKIERDLAVQLRLLSGWVPELPVEEPPQTTNDPRLEALSTRAKVRQMTPRQVHDARYGGLRAVCAHCYGRGTFLGEACPSCWNESRLDRPSALKRSPTAVMILIDEHKMWAVEKKTD
jgi:hypothetical protein